MFIKYKIFSCHVNKVIDLRPTERGMCFFVVGRSSFWFVLLRENNARNWAENAVSLMRRRFCGDSFAVVIYCL